jgi:hypothetical protein
MANTTQKAENSISGKAPRNDKEKMVIPPRQCTCSFKCIWPTKNNGTEVRTSCASLCSPHLGPFSKIKKKLTGKRFWPNEEVIDAVNTNFEDLEEKRERIEKLEKL